MDSSPKQFNFVNNYSPSNHSKCTGPFFHLWKCVTWADTEKNILLNKVRIYMLFYSFAHKGNPLAS